MIDTETQAAATEPLPGAPAPDDGARRDDARLAEAVSGVAKIVPRAPQGLLEPRLRTPLFAAFLALAVATHVLGLGAHLLLTWSEGFGGRRAEATGITVIDTEIIDGRDMPELGGRKEQDSPGDPAPLATASIDQAASRAQPRSVPIAPVTELTAKSKTETSPPASSPQEVLATDRLAEAEVAMLVPPPPFMLDTTIPPAIEPARDPQPEKPEMPVAEVAPLPPSQQSPSQAAPAQQASQASLSGDGGMAQSVTDTPSGNGGIAAATPGEIKTYHARLGAHIRAHRPANNGRPGKVVVVFGLDADGGVRFAEIKTSSGNAFLETKSLAAINKAAPYPKPPRGMTGKQLEFEVPIGFQR